MIFWILLKTLLLKGDVGKKIRFNLFNQHCFEYTNSSKYDRFLFLRELKLLFKSFFISKEGKKIHPIGVGLYVLSNLNIKGKVEFISSSFENIDFIVNKRDIYLYSTLKFKILISFIILLTFPYFFSRTFFIQKNRINHTLFIRHVYISLVLCSFLKANCKKIYFFYPHEPESNLIINMLETMNIDIIVIPNTNPLFMYNKNIIGNKILLTLGYQVEELLFFNPTYEGSILLKEDFQLKEYHNNFSSKSNNKICYYSHASWLRIENDQHIPSFNEVKIELELLEYLNSKGLFKDVELTICLHPKEKESSVIEKAQKYYKGIFGNDINFFQNSSYESFKEYDLGFGAFSSILFERIHCGYKTLIFNQHIKEFPLENSSFNKFIVNDIEKFKSKLNQAIIEETKVFFNGLIKYTFLHENFKNG